MRLRAARYAIYAVCVAFLVAILLWIFLTPSNAPEELHSNEAWGGMKSVIGLGLFVFGSEIVAVASLLIGSSNRVTLESFEGPPDQIRRILSYSLRKEGVLVEERPEDLKIKIARYHSARIITSRNNGTTGVEVAPDLSTDGWVVAVLVIMLGFFGIAIVPLVLRGMSRAAAFANREIAPLINVQAGEEGREIDVRGMLVDSLSESRRLSKDAYDAEKSNYQDSVLLSVFSALILWAAIVMMAMWMNNIITESSLVTMVTVATVVALSFSLLSWFLIRRHAIPKLEKINDWNEDLENALQREIRRDIPGDGERSTFEILRDAYIEIPGWIRILSRSRAYREPVTTLLIFAFGLLAVNLLMGSISGVIRGESTSNWFFIMGIALFTTIVLVYRAIKRSSDRELRRGQEELMGRIKLAERRMEEILSGEGDTIGDSSR